MIVSRFPTVMESLRKPALVTKTPPTVEVTSPLDGVVLERSVTAGETVDPTKELFHVADQSHLLAQAEVYETDLASVRLDQTARVRVAPFPNRVFTGRVVRLANTIDPDRRTLRICRAARWTAQRVRRRLHGMHRRVAPHLTSRGGRHESEKEDGKQQRRDIAPRARQEACTPARVKGARVE